MKLFSSKKILIFLIFDIILISLLIVLIVLLLGKKSNTPEETNIQEANEADEAVIEDNANKKAEKKKKTVKETSLKPIATYKFSGGMQWLQMAYEDDPGYCYLCVDKKGDAVFSVEGSNVKKISPFSNGISFVETSKAAYQIDLNGNIIKTYPFSDNYKVKAYSDGQIWTEEYNSDFNSAKYTYTLYDEKGKEITEFFVEGTDPIDAIYYCGKGIWQYDTYNNGDHVQRFYFKQSNKWIEHPSSYGNYNFYFYEDTAAIGIEYEDPDITGYRAQLLLMDTNGNLKKVGLTRDLGWNWHDDIYVNEGYCILTEISGYLVSYNLSSGEFKVMNNEYTEKLRPEAFPDHLMFSDGVVGLPLKGDDDKDYVGLFDTSWNIIGEPIPCEKYDYSEGKLMVCQSISDGYQGGSHREVHVYNSKGMEIINGYEKGYMAFTPFKDGQALILDNNTGDLTLASASQYIDIVTPENHSDEAPFPYEWKCIDEKGEYLYDTINFDQMETVELE